MSIAIPEGTQGWVGISNDGFYGMSVDSSKRYAGSFSVRGAYQGEVNLGFRNKLTGMRLSDDNITLHSYDDSWSTVNIPVFEPLSAAGNPNNTFEFLFDASTLSGKSISVNLLSVFKQTFNDRPNGVREDLATAYNDLESSWIRLPGGNNMQGFSVGNEFNFTETLGDLKTRPGRLGTWTDIDTSGFGMLEQLQWAIDSGQEVFLGIFAGLFIGGGVIPQNQLQPYVDLAMDQLEFLLGSSSTTWGKVRASLGYPDPFALKFVEIGNEDFFGEPSYSDYRFDAFYQAIKATYPELVLLSTVSPAPNGLTGAQNVWADEHIYANEDTFAGLYNRYDNHDRSRPVIVGEYAAVVTGSNPGQAGQQTMGMALSEAIMLLGCERNSDIVKGTSYGALIKSYDEEPGTVAVIKHTADATLKSLSFYVQKLFAQNHGDATLPVTTEGGDGIGPVYWSATKRNTGATILKLVNYHGPGSAVNIVFEGSNAGEAQVVTFTTPNCGSINNLPYLGGESGSITTSTLQGQNGKFAVYFGNECEVKILTV